MLQPAQCAAKLGQGIFFGALKQCVPSTRLASSLGQLVSKPKCTGSKVNMMTPDQRQRTGSEASKKHGCGIGMSGTLQDFL